MAWNRRKFVAGIGLTAIAACERKITSSARNEAVSAPAVAPPKPTMHYQPAGPGYSLSDGPAPFSFDDEDLLEIRDGVLIRRDVALKEISRLALTDVTSFAVLADRSLVVAVNPLPNAPRVHRVVSGRSQASYPFGGTMPAPTDNSNEIWVVDTHSVSREEFGTDKLAGMLVPNVAYPLPLNMLPGFAALSDGTIAVSNTTALLHADTTKLTSYAWSGGSRQLGPGPEPRTLWASDNYTKIALVRLEGAAAKVIVRHALEKDEVLLHLAGSGEHAAAVIARTFDNAPTQFSVAVYTAKGEQWRAPLDSARQVFYAALSATRVVVRAGPQYLLRAWDLATGCRKAWFRLRARQAHHSPSTTIFISSRMRILRVACSSNTGRRRIVRRQRARSSARTTSCSPGLLRSTLETADSRTS